MTLEKNRPDDTAPADTAMGAPRATQGMPALEPLVRGPRTAISAAVARRLFRAAVSAFCSLTRPSRCTARTSSTRAWAATD